MDNDKNKQNTSNENEVAPQDESSLVDSEKEVENREVQSTEPEDEEVNHWVREVSDDPEMENDDIVESLDNIPVNKGDLPDWINELSPADQEIFDSEENLQEGEEIPKSTSFDSQDELLDDEYQMDESVYEEEKDIAETSDRLDEGFVEISEYDLSAIDEQEEEPQLMRETKVEQEELPDWLEDMITEEEEPSLEENENAIDERLFMSDEPTKPVPIIEESSSADFQEEAIEEITEAPNLNLDEIEIKEAEPQTEESIHIVDFEEDSELKERALYEGSLIPTDYEMREIPDEEEVIIFSDEIQDNEDLDTQDEKWELQDNQPVEIPKTLRFAKYLLDQGEIDPANEIFQTYIHRGDHLEEIKTWVEDAINEEKLSQSKLWEILGDIALQQSDHAEALSAYTSSISILLNNQ